MIANDHELKVTLERIARFQEQVAHLRRVEVTLAMTLMGMAKFVGHKHVHRFADQLRKRVAEHSLRGRVEGYRRAR